MSPCRKGQIDYIAFMLDPQAWFGFSDDHIRYHLQHPDSSPAMLSRGEEFLQRREGSFDLAIDVLSAINMYYSAEICAHPVYSEHLNAQPFGDGSQGVPGPRCPLCNRRELLIQRPDGETLRYRPPTT